LLDEAFKWRRSTPIKKMAIGPSGKMAKSAAGRKSLRSSQNRVEPPGLGRVFGVSSEEKKKGEPVGRGCVFNSHKEILTTRGRGRGRAE